MSGVVYPRLGAHRPEVLVGPQFGVDNCVVRIGEETVMVSTTDPLSFIPSLQPRESALLSVHLLASDLTTSGFPPQYGIFDFNLPPRMRDSEFADYWKAFHEECKRLGIAIVGGHTGRFEGCDYTIIGGGVIWSIGPEEDYLVSSMAEDGDDLILTKSVAFGASAVLTRAFPRTVKKALGESLFEKAWKYLSIMSTVKEARAAASVGVHRKGVTAMHDATEGGVAAAILELANASKLGAEVSLENLPISDETKIVCDLFRIDPLTSLSEGSLIIASRPDRTRRVLNAVSQKGIEAEVVGSLSSKFQGCYGLAKRGRSIIRYPARDPYWQAFWRGVHKGWK